MIVKDIPEDLSQDIKNILQENKYYGFYFSFQFQKDIEKVMERFFHGDSLFEHLYKTDEENMLTSASLIHVCFIFEHELKKDFPVGRKEIKELVDFVYKNPHIFGTNSAISLRTTRGDYDSHHAELLSYTFRCIKNFTVCKNGTIRLNYYSPNLWNSYTCRIDSEIEQFFLVLL